MWSASQTIGETESGKAVASVRTGPVNFSQSAYIRCIFKRYILQQKCLKKWTGSAQLQEHDGITFNPLLCFYADGVPLDRNTSDMAVTLRSREELYQPTPVYWDIHANGKHVSTWCTITLLRLLTTRSPNCPPKEYYLLCITGSKCVQTWLSGFYKVVQLHKPC